MVSLKDHPSVPTFAEDLETQDLDPDAFNAFFRSEIERWSPLVRSLQTPKS